MRLVGMKDGPTMEIIALPALALFYLLLTPFLVGAQAVRSPIRMVLSILGGLFLAASLISLLFYTLGWLERTDMLTNSSLLQGLLILGGLLGWRNGEPFLAKMGMRAGVLLAIIIILSFLPLARVGGIA